MSLCNVAYQWVVLLTSIIVGVNGQSHNCGVDDLHCDAPTRLPGFVPSHCSHPCNSISPDGGCRLNALCFFTTVVGLVQPAGYEHLLNLPGVETVKDAERKISDLCYATGEEKEKLDGLENMIAATFAQFIEYILGTNKLVFPDEITNSPCSGFCKSVDLNGECKMNATCYFQNKLAQSTTIKNSHLLDLSSIDHDFDEYSLVINLVGRINEEKIKLDTFSMFTINTFNVMVDIAVSNGDPDLERYGCLRIYGRGDFDLTSETLSLCLGVCRKLTSRGDCVDDLKCLFSTYYSTNKSFSKKKRMMELHNDLDLIKEFNDD